MPQDQRLGGKLFLSCLSFCHSIKVCNSICNSVWNLKLKFWTVSARALIFPKSNPIYETVPLIPTFYNLWPWPWSFTYSFENSNVVNNFEQWGLELSYFTWVFLQTRPFCGYQHFDPVTLTWRLTYFLKTLILLVTC